MSDAIKQSLDKPPIYEEIEWEKPVNKRQAGELLIVGGSPHGFATIGNSYDYAQKAGAGRVSIAMPSATKAVVEGMLPGAHFLPSTISGSFSKTGLRELKSFASDSWATLLAGDFGRNSETSLLVEGFLISHVGRIIISKDAVDFAATSYPRQVINREGTLLVASLSQLQKLLKQANVESNVTFNMTVAQLIDYLADLTETHDSLIITVHHSNIFVAVKGQISVTPLGFDEGLWQTKVAAYASVYWMQHENKPFKALTSAVHEALRPEKTSQ